MGTDGGGPQGGSHEDLYLSPHFDDVCFSLGAWVRGRGRGRLLTVFSKSAFVAKGNRPGRGEASARTEEVSALRRAEDLAFCRAVGLRPSELGLHEAPLRGRPPFADSLRNSGRDAAEFGGAIREVLLAAGKDCVADGRPWLMCPAGIGDHVDHLVVLRVVLRSLDALRSVFRVGFYEDLHYAADGRAWKAGVARLQEWIAPTRPRRFAHRVDDVEAKLGLIGLYRSQLGPGPISIGEYTPGHAYTSGPHEAFWSLEP